MKCGTPNHRQCLSEVNISERKKAGSLGMEVKPLAVFRHKKGLTISCKPLVCLAPRPGLEPGTH